MVNTVNYFRYTGKDNDGNKMYWKYIKDIDYNIIANYIINNIQIKIER